MLHYAHLARREVLAVRYAPPDALPPQIAQIQELISEMPEWGLPVMILTLMAGLLLISSVRYTLQGVVSTLVMIESPHTTVIVREEKPKMEYPDALIEEVIDSEVIVIKQIPVTARIRTTMRHLRMRGGFAARWRGLSTMFVWTMGYGLIKNVLSSLLMPVLAYGQSEQVMMLADPLFSIAAWVLLARIGLTWTHIVISEPSPKRWYQRIPSRKAWRQIRGPTLLTAMAWKLNLVMPALVAWELGLLDGPQALEGESPECMLIKLFAVGAIAVVTFVGITIPAEVALTRVQASLLPEEDEAIVPFDRTFGGAVVPEIVGGSGKLGYLQAWQTFNGAARIRLLKLYAKIFMIDIALHMLVMLALVTEFIVLVGPKAYDLLDQLSRNGRPNSDEMTKARFEAVVLG